MCICYNKSYLNEDWCKIEKLLIIVWSEAKYAETQTIRVDHIIENG